MLLIILQHLLLLHLKSIHRYFGLPQHIMCTHPDQDMNYFAIHLHFQGLLSGILSLLTPKTHIRSNSSNVCNRGGSEILPHNCYMQCYTDYRKYIMYTKCEFNVMTVIIYAIWCCTCIPDICCSITLPCSMELYISYSLTLDWILRPKYPFIVHV